MAVRRRRRVEDGRHPSRRRSGQVTRMDHVQVILCCSWHIRPAEFPDFQFAAVESAVESELAAIDLCCPGICMCEPRREREHARTVFGDISAATDRRRAHGFRARITAARGRRARQDLRRPAPRRHRSSGAGRLGPALRTLP